MRKSEAQRIALQKEQEAKGEEFKGWEVKKWVFWVFGGQLASMISVSWIVSSRARFSRFWKMEADELDISCLHHWSQTKVEQGISNCRKCINRLG